MIENSYHYLNLFILFNTKFKYLLGQKECMIGLFQIPYVASLTNLYDQAQTAIGNKYLFALAILIAFYVLSKLFLWITEKIVLRVTAKTSTSIDDQLVHTAKRPISLILLMFGIKLAVLPLGMVGKAGELISILITTGIIIFATIAVIRIIIIIIDNWGHHWAQRTKSSVDDAVLPLFRKMVKIVLWIFCALFILSYWGFDIRGLLAGVGIAGLAIGFAVKDSLANIFGGISLILDKAIRTGDIIKLDSGEEGTVLDVGLRSTKIKTRDNEVIILPNGVLANSKVHNYKLPDLSARVVVPFNVAYGTDPDKVKKAIGDALKGLKEIMKDPPPTVKFIDMGEFALQFKALFWVPDVTQRKDKREEAVNLVYKTLNKYKIEIPFPTRVVYLKKK